MAAEIDLKSTPNRLRELRKRERMTIDQVADAVTALGKEPNSPYFGITLHRSTLSKLENGERRITEDVGAAIAAVLKVSMDSLTAPSERPVVTLVPIIQWAQLPIVLSGREIEADHVVPVLSTGHRLVAIRLEPGDVAREHADAGRLGGITVIDLDDVLPHIENGIFACGWARAFGLAVCNGDLWVDLSQPGSDPIRNAKVTAYGRVIQCIVEPLYEPKHSSDFYVPAGQEEHDAHSHMGPGMATKLLKNQG